ncbi:MAG TPA: M28 family peptidase [Thermoanaerobaculia bacterium]|nr:M28 family peptidase [Thermoanaerobaculia bacterium]
MKTIVRIALMLGVAIVIAVALVRQPVWSGRPYDVRTRSDPRTLHRHVVLLTHVPRCADQPRELDRAAAYIQQMFRASGGRVSSQEFAARGRQYRNVMVAFGPAPTKEQPLMIVGAHYDVFCNGAALPGADDNASGTAGLLELARLLGAHPPTRPLLLVAYTTEEPPFFASAQMGSAVHAESLKDTPVAGMICLEMIGYYAEEQRWPNVTFAALYPSRGDFIAVGGGWNDRHLARDVKRGLLGARGIRALSFTGPRTTMDASDQRNYWSLGIPAVLVTDTAFLRNPNYHTRGDTAETLDYTRMARVVDGVFNAVR